MARPSSSSRPHYLAWVVAPLVAALIGLSLLAQPSGPSIQVLDGTTTIPLNGTDAYTPPTKVGTDNSKTFTVKNTGNADLLVAEAISVPVGFTLMRNFPGVPNATLNGAPAYTIPMNTSATFTVALNSATAGDFSGAVSFATNDTNNNPFVFNVTGTALEPPSVRIVDDIDSGFSATAGWTSVTPTTGTAPFNLSLQVVPAGTGTQTATWTFNNLEPGDYHVAATWPGNGTAGATNATYAVCDPNISDPNQQVLGTVQVNQQADSAGFTDAGSTWQDLGVFTITGSAAAGPTLLVKLTDNANGTVSADAVRIERVGYPGAIIDDTSTQFSTSQGTWTRVAGTSDFQKGRSTAAGNDGATATAAAQWTFSVAPGTYRVVASYGGYAGYATSAPYRVFDNTTSLTPNAILVDQTAAPMDTGGFGAGWKHLGFFTVASTTLVVQLSNENTGAGKTVDADAVAIELVNTPTIVSTADAFRFLEQASWGPTPGDIANVQSLGLNGWLSQQFTLTPSPYGPLPLYNTNNNVANNNLSCYGDPTVAGNPARTACVRDHYSMYPLQNTLFWYALYQQDQLNQRVAWALHKIWVISGVEVTQTAWMAYYLDTLGTDALTNYRTLMYDVTLNPGMGNYLNMAGSTKANPNENYPRELMQLFAIGLYELNPDGTQKLDSSSQPIPTYDQNLVNNMTQVFTGWNRAPQVATNVPNYMDPMRLNGTATENPTNHDFTAKTLLRGHVQPAITGTANTTGAVGIANAYAQLNDGLDNIYYHPSCAPFICKQLIQQLVTSNPSPAYVARVVDTWNRNNTAATQMQLVVTAILLDPEARGDRKNAVNYGHLKEPVLYITNLMRLFSAQSDDLTQQSDGYLNPLAITMGQDVFRPPSVFSYFSPSKVAVGGNPPVVGPEFQIQNTSTALARANFINTAVTPNSSRAIDVVRAHGTTPNGTDPSGNPIVPTGPLGTAIDVTALFQVAGDAGGLVDTLNASMLHGSMSPEMRTAIVTAVNAVTVSNPPTTQQLRKRVHTAIYLIASSSQYQVQR